MTLYTTDKWGHVFTTIVCPVCFGDANWLGYRTNNPSEQLSRIECEECSGCGQITVEVEVEVDDDNNRSNPNAPPR